MAEQVITLAVDLMGQAGTGTDNSWKTPGYINGDSTGGGRSYWADGVKSADPQSLINALAAISSSTTKTTKIQIEWTLPTEANTHRAENQDQVGCYTMSVFIDWENMVVKWSGHQRWTGESVSYREPPERYAIYSGKKTISSSGSTVSLSWAPGPNGNGHYSNRYSGQLAQTMVLKTGANRNITALPAPITSGGRNDTSPRFGLTMHGNYMVTTDNGMTVSVAPEAPAETPETVSGIKISELNAADSLTDTDLFVLSRDDPAGESYDKSLNITLANLRAGLGTSFRSGKWVSGDTLSIPTTSVTSCAISIATGLNDGEAVQDETGNIMGQFDVSSKALYLTQVYTGGSGSNAIPTENTLTLTNVFQDMLIKPTYLGVTVRAKFDADTLYIELSQANMRGTYLITLS